MTAHDTFFAANLGQGFGGADERSLLGHPPTASSGEAHPLYPGSAECTETGLCRDLHGSSVTATSQDKTSGSKHSWRTSYELSFSVHSPDSPHTPRASPHELSHGLPLWDEGVRSSGLDSSSTAGPAFRSSSVAKLPSLGAAPARPMPQVPGQRAEQEAEQHEHPHAEPTPASGADQNPQQVQQQKPQHRQVHQPAAYQQVPQPAFQAGQQPQPSFQSSNAPALPSGDALMLDYSPLDDDWPRLSLPLLSSGPWPGTEGLGSGSFDAAQSFAYDSAALPDPACTAGAQQEAGAAFPDADRDLFGAALRCLEPDQAGPSVQGRAGQAATTLPQLPTTPFLQITAPFPEPDMVSEPGAFSDPHGHGSREWSHEWSGIGARAESAPVAHASGWQPALQHCFSESEHQQWASLPDHVQQMPLPPHKRSRHSVDNGRSRYSQASYSRPTTARRSLSQTHSQSQSHGHSHGHSYGHRRRLTLAQVRQQEQREAEAAAVQDLQYLVGQIDGHTKLTIKDAMYRLSRAANQRRTGHMSPAPAASARRIAVDQIVANLLYSNFAPADEVADSDAAVAASELHDHYATRRQAGRRAYRPAPLQLPCMEIQDMLL